ncbi:MAG: glycosyltransferase [Campylobacter sp.]|nr:glycosyltransferase [Campylobacter sp.]
MQDMPLVSVVIPSYNHEKYISETITAILNQTYKNIELIIIDDGSKDNSPNIIENFRKKHNFTFIHRQNRGLCATLNQAIDLAHGKYFAICASDDVLLPDSIEKRVNFMEKNSEFGMCYGKVCNFSDEKNIINVGEPASGWIFEELLSRYFIPAASIMIKKDVYSEVGKYDENLIIEDYDMSLRIAEKFQIGFIDEILARYRLHGENTTKQLYRMYEGQKQIIYKWQNKENFKILTTNWRLKWFDMFSRNNKKEALKYLNTALCNPFNKYSLKGLIKFIFFWTKK